MPGTRNQKTLGRLTTPTSHRPAPTGKQYPYLDALHSVQVLLLYAL